MIKGETIELEKNVPARLTDGSGAGEVRIHSDADLLIGGEKGNIHFPIDKGAQSFTVLLTEEIWAVSKTGKATVQVLQFGR